MPILLLLPEVVCDNRIIQVAPLCLLRQCRQIQQEQLLVEWNDDVINDSLLLPI